MIEASQVVRATVSRLIEAGSLGNEIIEAVFDGAKFAPYEGYLFDYKAKWPETKLELKKLVRHVAAFHNVFGGYIFFGVDEVKAETLFLPILKEEPKTDVKQFKDLVREHLSAPIEITLRTHEIKAEGATHHICVLHIPKRARDAEPVTVRRGATDNTKKLLEENAVYLRDGDNSIPASQPLHWKTLFGTRMNPYLSAVTSVTPLESNLPDRSIIYREFVGRTDELAELWSWFNDDFSRVRVLAGEGGLGKTSIAYEFASDVCRTAPMSFECVIWLTAKQRQFRAMKDAYEELGLETFDDVPSMLRQVGARLCLTDEELNDTPDSQLPRLVKKAAENIIALVVVDDLDSLLPDEQRRAIEVCQQFAGAQSRFLFTTRNNVTASAASSIEIRGFDQEELADFTNSWCERLRLAPLSANDLDHLMRTTGGSPLFVESILRLLRGGMPIADALKQWRNHLGLEVRNAALKREVLQLRHEAKKMLVIISTLGSCSFAEVKDILGFSDTTMVDAANDLQTLFLIDSPQIAGTPRYAISSTTRQLVRSLGKEVLPEYDELVKKVHASKYRSVVNDKAAPLRSVAAAINQAMAQIAGGTPDLAVKTVDEVNTRLGGKNADLLSVRARALAAMQNTSAGDIRRAFEKAYDAGQRKDIFFDQWYKTEIASTDFDGAIGVVDRALKSDPGNPVYWLNHRIDARARAVQRYQANDPEHAATQVRNALADIKNMKAAAVSSKQPLMVESALRYAENFSDLQWGIARPSGVLEKWLGTITAQRECIELGDQRVDTYLRLAVAFVGFWKALPANSESAQSLLEQQLRLIKECYKRAPRWVAQDANFQVARRDLDMVNWTGAH